MTRENYRRLEKLDKRMCDDISWFNRLTDKIGEACRRVDNQTEEEVRAEFRRNMDMDRSRFVREMRDNL